MHVDWIFDADAFSTLLRSLEFPGEVTDALLQAAATLQGQPEAKARFLTFAGQWFRSEADELEAGEPPVWYSLAMAAAFPEMLAFHKQRGIPWEITIATAGDLPRRMLNFLELHGCWGLDCQRWMRSHVHGKLYQLGRLQYNSGKFLYPVNVYREGDSTVAFARPGTCFGEDNWPVPADSDQVVWRATLEIEGDRLSGHRVTSTGALERERTTIPADAPCLLNAESDVLYVHIPMGAKLDTALCRESLEQALPFFKRYFPETPWAGITTGTWLLDRAFCDFLPPESNIVAFGQLFTAIPHPHPNDTTHYRWAFGAGMNFEKAMQLPRKTSLQAAMLRYVSDGGVFRNTGGYIVRG